MTSSGHASPQLVQKHGTVNVPVMTAELPPASNGAAPLRLDELGVAPFTGDLCCHTGDVQPLRDPTEEMHVHY